MSESNTPEDPASTEEKNNQQVDGNAEENKLIAQRREKLADLRDRGQAYPNHFRREHLAGELQAEYAEQSKDQLQELGKPVRVAGRLMANRGAFMVLQDMSGRIQLYVNRKALDKETLKAIKSWDLGDIIGASGLLHKSGKGDLYVDMAEAHLLVKALRPLPDKYKGLADQEIRYRQRYLDLIVNEEAQKTFRVRSKIIEAIRHYLAERQFIEVETPMMQVIPGGATAKPFITQHNALDLQMYLRIAPELYLKRLVVGGFEKVFEINRNFRNEGLSTRHNPEFTMLEFYEAYQDYHHLMDLTEDLLRYVAQEVLGTQTLVYQESTHDLSQPFKRLTVLESILAYNPDIKAEQLNELPAAKALAAQLGIESKASWGLGKVQIEIFEATVEHRLHEPTFITEYPTEVSPLARRNDSNPLVTDRFEFFVGGREIANGFSELNDAEDQAERFRQQVLEKEAGDDEAMFFDEDYVVALEHGLPPTAGEGIGIDRLVMLFTDAPTIKDVILFPHMKPKGS